MSRRFNSQQEMLHALKLQAMYNANQSNPKSRITTAGHTNPPEIYAQQNAIAQQINAIVKGNQNFTLPDPPTDVSAILHNGYFDISWTAPVKTGGTLITGYSILAYDCFTGAVKTFVSSGAGTGPYRIFTSKDDTPSTIQVRQPVYFIGQYSFYVGAVNIIGRSKDNAISAQECQQSYMDPDAPILTTAVAGFDGTADITWTAPAQFGGLPDTDVGWTYRISVTPAGGSANTTRTKQSPDEEIDYTVTGLTNGTSYTFAIRLENTTAPNEAAVSPYSTQTLPGVIPGAPKKPTNVDGASGVNEAVSLTWIASETPDDSPITSYTIVAFDYALGEDLPPVVSSGSGTTYNYTGLTNGQAYAFKVRATNPNGVSPYSTSGGPYTPYTVPVAPGAIEATFTPSFSAITFTWNPPVSNGGNAVTDYHLKVYQAGSPNILRYELLSVKDSADYNPATPTSITVSTQVLGVSQDTVLYFQVAAINLAGGSTFATSRQYSVPDTSPELRLAVFSSDYSSVTFFWDPRGTDGGIPVTDYHVQAYLPNDSDRLLSDFYLGNINAVATITAAVAGWTLGDVLAFRVAAKNALGDGPFGTSVQYGPPGAPSVQIADISYPPIDGTALITLRYPTSRGNIQPITGFVVIAHDVVSGTDLPPQPLTTTGNGDGTFTVTGLTNARAYKMKLAAVNYGGQGPYSSLTSSSVTPYTYPAAPTGVSGSGANQSAIVSWTPGANNGSSILDYTVQSTDTQDSTTMTRIASSSPYTFTGLTNGRSYTFKVLQGNARGDSSYSSPSSSTSVGIPGQYSFFFYSGKGTDGSVGTYWTKPVPIGVPATSFLLTVNNKTTSVTTTQTISLTGEPTNAFIGGTVTGLVNTNTYTFQLTARNGDSSGPISTESQSYTPYGEPLALASPTVVWGTASTGPNGPRTATVSWVRTVGDPNVGGYRIDFIQANSINNSYGSVFETYNPNENTMIATFDQATKDANPTWTLLYGPAAGTPSIPYNIVISAFNQAFVSGPTTSNNNGGAFWVTV